MARVSGIIDKLRWVGKESFLVIDAVSDKTALNRSKLSEK